jgi:threonine/homoserine/homoserine lactone efflux protein
MTGATQIFGEGLSRATSMPSLTLLAKGMLAGLAISVPVGPVNVLCVSRTLTKGRAAGLMSGFGAATADAFYGSIAGFSISFVIRFLIREEHWIRMWGGILLMAIGLAYYFKPPHQLGKENGASSNQANYISTLLLTLTNPTSVLSFLAILAALGLGRHEAWSLTSRLVLGIFCGSMLWWTVLVSAVDRFRDRFHSGAMLWMNRIAGIAIGGFGAFTFLLSRTY